jgi:glycosyltransferase involved in cell wall biosynthesis
VKVLLITGTFPPGKCGIGDYSYSLAKALAFYRDVHVAVLTSNFCERGKEPDRVKVYPVINQWRFVEATRVIKVIRDWMPDIVHIQYPSQGFGKRLLPWLLPIIAYLLGARVVQTWHEGYSRRHVLGFLLKSLVPSSIVIVRPNYKKELRPLFRWFVKKKKFVFIRNASSIPIVVLKETEKSELRAHYLQGQKRLVVFFGFVYPHKGVEQLFDIANPVSDHIVIAGEVREGDAYLSTIIGLASQDAWRGKVTVTGYISAFDVAALLAVADAVILPFRVGGGEWNTSIHTAILHGTLVITTSLTRNGYDARSNIYYAKPNDIQEMKLALQAHAGTRRVPDTELDKDEWQQIAFEHRALYRSLFVVG